MTLYKTTNPQIYFYLWHVYKHYWPHQCLIYWLSAPVILPGWSGQQWSIAVRVPPHLDSLCGNSSSSSNSSTGTMAPHYVFTCAAVWEVLLHKRLAWIFMSRAATITASTVSLLVGINTRKDGLRWLVSTNWTPNKTVRFVQVNCSKVGFVFPRDKITKKFIKKTLKVSHQTHRGRLHQLKYMCGKQRQ